MAGLMRNMSTNNLLMLRDMAKAFLVHILQPVLDVHNHYRLLYTGLPYLFLEHLAPPPNLQHSSLDQFWPKGWWSTCGQPTTLVVSCPQGFSWVLTESPEVPRVLYSCAGAATSHARVHETGRKTMVGSNNIHLKMLGKGRTPASPSVCWCWSTCLSFPLLIQ